ncbi:MAG TPA: sulfatase-like hydrolase/transferase [Isosphaeraceae bacterium]|jgi:choline-sulfatase|nr:sulfatase-like hydrolase/transferase [Isosphaeraceae bacterium]
MRPPRWVWLALLFLLAAVRPETASRRLRADRHPVSARADAPNLLIIVGDDHAGGMLGIDGDRYHATPRLDGLAAEGVRFDHAYCNSPLCTPSRQSFITGRLPHAVGVTKLMTRLPDEAVTLGDWLADMGYHTAAYGKMHFNGHSNHGFAERLDTEDWERYLQEHPPASDQRRPWLPFKTPATLWLNAACRSDGLPESAMQSTYYADRAGEFFRQTRNQPYALVVGLYDPHSPFRFPDEWAGRFRPDQFPVPSVSERDRREQPRVFGSLQPKDVQGIQAAYYTSLSYVDHVVGRILDDLENSGQADNTIVVYLGDNGYMRGQHGRFEKHCFYEPAVRVPLIVRWPGHLPAGRRVTDMVELVDLLPTLLDLCGLPNPPDLHGQSLVPLARGEAGARGRAAVFSEYLENEEAMVRSDRYKLIVGTGRVRRKDGYDNARPLRGPYARLYDLQADPDETTDLASVSEFSKIKNELMDSLYDRLVSTREGVEPVPSGLSRLEAIHWCLVPRD